MSERAAWRSAPSASAASSRAGAVVRARRSPDPVPGVFGDHEALHACVLLALAAHVAAIAFEVRPHA